MLVANGWLGEGSTAWRTPSGSRAPPKPTATALCWDATSRRSPIAWRRDGMTVVAAPTGGFSILGRVQGGCHERHRRERPRHPSLPRWRAAGHDPAARTLLDDRL